MAWSAKTNATQLTSVVDTIQWFDTLFTLNPGETAHVEISFNPVASPTDDLSFHVRRTLDPSTEVWDDTDYMSGVIANSPDPNKVSFDLAGGYRYRIGVQTTGATDSNVADLSYRTDGVSL